MTVLINVEIFAFADLSFADLIFAELTFANFDICDISDTVDVILDRFC